jgi:dolichol-phosphate mannosyltransferase
MNKEEVRSQTGSDQTNSLESQVSKTKSNGFNVALGLITVMSAILYVCLSVYWPKFSRAEVFFAECAREMIATSNYVTPLYHGQGFFDKPILCYWFIIGCFKTFGITHFVARIPSILASIATLVVTGYATRAVFGARAGLIATMALATSFMYLSFSALCMSDSMLVLIDSLTLILLYAGYRKGESAGRLNRTSLWFLAAASMGVGFLTKGPVAVVLPSVFFLAYLFTEKQLKTIRLKHILFGALALCIIGAPWFYLAYQANGIEAITYFFIRENVQRFAGATYDTHKPIWFMVVSLLGGFLPWSIFLPPILYVSVKNLIESRKRTSMIQAEEIASARFQSPSTQSETARINSLQLYLWLWIAVAIGFFSFSRGKIDYYALPAFPACAMLTGYFISKWIDDGNKLTTVAAAFLNITLIAVGAGIALFLGALPYATAIPAVVVGLIPAAIGIFGLTNLSRHKLIRSYATIFGGVAITGSIFAVVAMPVLIKMLPALSYADTIKASPGEQTKIGMYSGIEHWVDEVTFRTEREPVKLASQSDLDTFLSAPGRHWLMIKNHDFDALSETLKQEFEIVARQGFIPKSLNPGYILKHRGDLTLGNELILARRK